MALSFTSVIPFRRMMKISTRRNTGAVLFVLILIIVLLYSYCLGNGNCYSFHFLSWALPKSQSLKTATVITSQHHKQGPSSSSAHKQGVAEKGQTVYFEGTVRKPTPQRIDKHKKPAKAKQHVKEFIAIPMNKSMLSKIMQMKHQKNENLTAAKDIVDDSHSQQENQEIETEDTESDKELVREERIDPTVDKYAEDEEIPGDNPKTKPKPTPEPTPKLATKPTSASTPKPPHKAMNEPTSKPTTESTPKPPHKAINEPTSKPTPEPTEKPHPEHNKELVRHERVDLEDEDEDEGTETDSQEKNRIDPKSKEEEPSHVGDSNEHGKHGSAVSQDSTVPVQSEKVEDVPKGRNGVQETNQTSDSKETENDEVSDTGEEPGEDVEDENEHESDKSTNVDKRADESEEDRKNEEEKDNQQESEENAEDNGTGHETLESKEIQNDEIEEEYDENRTNETGDEEEEENEVKENRKTVTEEKDNVSVDEKNNDDSSEEPEGNEVNEPAQESEEHEDMQSPGKESDDDKDTVVKEETVQKSDRQESSNVSQRVVDNTEKNENSTDEEQSEDEGKEKEVADIAQKFDRQESTSMAQNIEDNTEKMEKSSTKMQSEDEVKEAVDDVHSEDEKSREPASVETVSRAETVSTNVEQKTSESKEHEVSRAQNENKSNEGVDDSGNKIEEQTAKKEKGVEDGSANDTDRVPSSEKLESDSKDKEKAHTEDSTKDTAAQAENEESKELNKEKNSDDSRISSTESKSDQVSKAPTQTAHHESKKEDVEGAVANKPYQALDSSMPENDGIDPFARLKDRKVSPIPHNGIQRFDHLSCEPLHPHVLLYNRIFKTGSTTLESVLRKDGKKAGYIAKTGTTEDWYDDGNSYPYPKFITKMAKRHKENLAFSAHFYFRAYLRIKKQFTYINQVRDPVSRVISHYYYMRSEDRPIKRILEMKRSNHYNESLYTCVLHEHDKGCQQNTMTRFFCGAKKFCKEGSREALEQAKDNILRYYAVVGVLEQLDVYMEMLHKILPDFFLAKNEPLTVRRKANQNVQYNTDNVDQRTIKLIQEKNWADIELYNFIVDLFWKRAKLCGIS